MPYISQVSRVDIDYRLEPLVEFVATPGQANYAITALLLRALRPQTYTEYNSVIGVLECCKLEMYRRAVAPYEDRKASENGDVY